MSIDFERGNVKGNTLSLPFPFRVKGGEVVENVVIVRDLVLPMATHYEQVLQIRNAIRFLVEVLCEREASLYFFFIFEFMGPVPLFLGVNHEDFFFAFSKLLVCG